MAGSIDDHSIDDIWGSREGEPESRSGGCGCGCGFLVLLLAVVVIVGAVAYWQGFSPGFIQERLPWGEGDNGSRQSDGDDTEEGEGGPNVTLPTAPATTSTAVPPGTISPTVRAVGMPVGPDACAGLPNCAAAPGDPRRDASGPSSHPWSGLHR